MHSDVTGGSESASSVAWSVTQHFHSSMTCTVLSCSVYLMTWVLCLFQSLCATLWAVRKEKRRSVRQTAWASNLHEARNNRFILRGFERFVAPVWPPVPPLSSRHHTHTPSLPWLHIFCFSSIPPLLTSASPLSILRAPPPELLSLVSTVSAAISIQRLGAPAVNKELKCK